MADCVSVLITCLHFYACKEAAGCLRPNRDGADFLSFSCSEIFVVVESLLESTIATLAPAGERETLDRDTAHLVTKDIGIDSVLE